MNNIENLIYGFEKEILKAQNGIDITFDDAKITLTIRLDNIIINQINENKNKNAETASTVNDLVTFRDNWAVWKEKLLDITSKNSLNVLKVEPDNTFLVLPRLFKLIATEKDFDKSSSSMSSSWIPSKPFKKTSLYRLSINYMGAALGDFKLDISYLPLSADLHLEKIEYQSSKGYLAKKTIFLYHKDFLKQPAMLYLTIYMEPTDINFWFSSDPQDGTINNLPIDTTKMIVRVYEMENVFEEEKND